MGSSFSPGADVSVCHLIVLPGEKVEGVCSWFRSWDALTLSTQATGASGMGFPLCEDTIVLLVKKPCVVNRGGRNNWRSASKWRSLRECFLGLETESIDI